ISFRSWPAQKALPAPAMTTTRAVESAAISSSVDCSSRRSASESELYCSGRLSVSLTTPLSWARRSIREVYLLEADPPEARGLVEVALARERRPGERQPLPVAEGVEVHAPDVARPGRNGCPLRRRQRREGEGDLDGP